MKHVFCEFSPEYWNVERVSSSAMNKAESAEQIRQQNWLFCLKLNLLLVQYNKIEQDYHPNQTIQMRTRKPLAFREANDYLHMCNMPFWNIFFNKKELGESLFCFKKMLWFCQLYLVILHHTINRFYLIVMCEVVIMDIA